MNWLRDTGGIHYMPAKFDETETPFSSEYPLANFEFMLQFIYIKVAVPNIF